MSWFVLWTLHHHASLPPLLEGWETERPVTFTYLQFRWETPEAELALLTASHYCLLVIRDHDSRDAVWRSFSSPEGHSLQSTPHVGQIPDIEKLRKNIWLFFLNLGKLSYVIPQWRAEGGLLAQVQNYWLRLHCIWEPVMLMIEVIVALSCKARYIFTPWPRQSTLPLTQQKEKNHVFIGWLLRVQPSSQ